MILYSIVIAVYNVEKYLEECLESILAQSYSNWETILVDDGSTDEKSGKICDIYAKKDTRFKVFHRKNEGSLLARRFGMQHSLGDYILFADSDDYMHKDLLREVNQIIVDNQSDLVVYRFQWVGSSTATDSEIVFPEGTILGQDALSRQKLWKKVVTCNSLNNLWLKVAKRECIDMEEDYSSYASLKSGTDLMQSLPILDRAKKIYFTEKIFYYYRYNDSGISAQKAKKVGLSDIDKYFYDKKLLMERRVWYLKKNNAALEDNLKLHYASYFKSSMEILISWLSNEPSREKRKKIIKRVLKEQSLNGCQDYIILSDLSGINSELFRLFNNNDYMKFSFLLGLLVYRTKAIMLKGNFRREVQKCISRIKEKEK